MKHACKTFMAIMAVPLCLGRASGQPIQEGLDNTFEAIHRDLGDPTTFDRRVLIDFIGRPGLVNDQEVSALEQQFVITYNGLTNILCPPADFWRLHHVSIQREAIDSFGDLTETVQPGTAIRPFTWQAVVTVSCSGCPEEPGLFAEALRRTLLQVLGSSNTNQNDTNKRKLGSGDECEAPTELAFTDSYNGDIQVLRAQNKVVNIFEVLEVSEMEPFDCAEEVTPFSTIVAIDFRGNDALATQDQIDALEQGFLETYNALNALNDDICDPFFHTVTEVSLSPGLASVVVCPQVPKVLR